MGELRTSESKVNSIEAADQTGKQTRPSRPAPLELACAEFINDPTFAGHPPTPEQVARAWAWARFKKAGPSRTPEHAEVVAALKKLFPEFRTHKPELKSSRSS